MFPADDDNEVDVEGEEEENEEDDVEEGAEARCFSSILATCAMVN